MILVDFFRKHRMKITMCVPLVLWFLAWRNGLPRLPLAWGVLGITLVWAGIALRVWAAGYLVKDDLLTSWGPFALMRNPLYVGSFLIGLGFSALTAQWISCVLVSVVMMAVYGPLVAHEEFRLAQRFGEDYYAYQRVVPRWWPRLALPIASPSPFRWSQVRHHREHRHALMHLAMTAAFLGIYLVR